MTDLTPFARKIVDRLADAGENTQLASVLVAWWGQDGPRDKATEALAAVDVAIRGLQAVRDELASELGGAS